MTHVPQWRLPVSCHARAHGRCSCLQCHPCCCPPQQPAHGCLRRPSNRRNPCLCTPSNNRTTQNTQHYKALQHTLTDMTHVPQWRRPAPCQARAHARCCCRQCYPCCCPPQQTAQSSQSRPLNQHTRCHSKLSDNTTRQNTQHYKALQHIQINTMHVPQWRRPAPCHAMAAVPAAAASIIFSQCLPCENPVCCLYTP
jgi:hypothetical protein